MNEDGGKTSLWEKATSVVCDNMSSHDLSHWSLSDGYQNPTMNNNMISI